MASGRDIHSLEYYGKEEQEFKRFHTFQHYTETATPVKPALAGLGLLPGKTTARDLTHNWVDVESHLCGIGANDRVHPERSRPIAPASKQLPVLNMVKSADVILP